jgi:pyridoxine 4-dehydrogenase
VGAGACRAQGPLVNHIDTAAFYFSSTRSANELIDRALAPYPEDLVIATKVGPRRDNTGEWAPLASPTDGAATRRRTSASCVQNAYGLGFRPEQDDLVRGCGVRGVAHVPFFAIAGTGRADGVTGPEPREVTDVAREHDATPAQIRLAWAWQQGPHVLVIPGTGDPAHLVDNVDAGQVQLTAGDLIRLEAVHRREPAAPT